MAADKYDLLGPALSKIGRAAMSIVGGEPDGVYLYVEAGEGWVDISLYKDEGAQVRYFDAGETDLVDALFDAWYIEEPDKRWTVMHYTINGGKFNAEFEFGELRRAGESDDDRRERILHARYGDKPIVYPPPPKGAMEYRPSS